MRSLGIPGAVLLVVASLAFAGCGGDDEPSIEEIVGQISTTTTTTEAVTRDDVIASGDAVCAEANAAIANLAESSDPAVAADQVRAITTGLRRDLSALDAPTEGRSDFNALVSALGDQIRALRQRATTSRAADDAGYQAAGVALEAGRTEARAAAEAYGFEDCGQPFDQIETGSGATDGESGGTAPEVPVTPAEPSTPATPPDSAGGGTGAPDGGAGGSAGGSGSSDSGGVSPD